MSVVLINRADVGFVRRDEKNDSKAVVAATDSSLSKGVVSSRESKEAFPQYSVASEAKRYNG